MNLNRKKEGEIRFRTKELQLKNEVVPEFDLRPMLLVFFGRLLPELKFTDDYFHNILFDSVPDSIFSLLKNILPMRGMREFVECVTSYDLNNESSAVEIKTPGYYDLDYAENRFVSIFESRRGKKWAHRVLTDIVNSSLKELKTPDKRFVKNLDDLVEIYSLDYLETNLLLILFLIEVLESQNLLEATNRHEDNTKLLAKLLGVDSSRVLSILSDQGQLVSNGLIKTKAPRLATLITLPEIGPVAFEILSNPIPGGVGDKYVRRDKGRRYSLESFNLPDLRLGIVQDLIKTNEFCNILLHGNAGTGKTEFARSLAASQSDSVYFFYLDPEALLSNDDHRAELIAAQDRVSRENGILIIDEADNILQPGKTALTFEMDAQATEDLGKEWLTNFLENNKCRLIWIANRIEKLAPSIARRFDFSLRFYDLDRAQRFEMWKLKLREARVCLPDSEVKRFAAEYPVSSGLIASALKSCQEFKDDAKTMITRLEEVLERQLDLHGLNKLVDRATICQGYDPSALCLDTERQVFEDSLSGFVKQLESNERAGNLNLLFWGPSGTGKTEYARYLAGLVGRELIFKRASDLQNCYHGETEKAIRSAFQEASSSDSILLIDEADSFLFHRDQAHRSWEISAVNEFLTNMESFDGVLICCTNRLSEFDKASLRRFQWKIGFKPLEVEGRVNLFRKYFAPRGRLSLELITQLEGLDGLVPGDFKAVSDRLSFSLVGHQTKEVAIEELAKELRHRRGGQDLVGFFPGKARSAT